MGWNKKETVGISAEPSKTAEEKPSSIGAFNLSISKQGQQATQDSKYDKKNMKSWLLDSEVQENKFVCMILGSDGTGKSPLALSYMTDEDIKDGKRVVVIDLDGGNAPLINQYHSERCKKFGRKVSDVFLVKNPLKEVITNNGVEIDYIETFNLIKGIIHLLKDTEQRKELNIKYVIFDGLSTLLSHAENQMRVEKHLEVDGGVQLRFWLHRNKLFKESLESMKSLPISSFFIGHEDFIEPETGDFSKVKKASHAMMHQKIECKKVFGKENTTFVATITKSKYNIKVEGKEVTFGEVNRTTKEVKFEPEKVLEGLI